MALEDILAAIRSNADTEIARIRSESDAAVETIVAEARAASRAAEQEAASSLDAEAEDQRARIVNRARLIVDRQLREAAESIYIEITDEVVAQLSQLRSTGRYREVFTTLFDECIAVLPEARVVRIDPVDVDVARSLVEAQDVDGYVLDSSIETIGGLQLVTADGRRQVGNTFESRFERADRPLRSLAASVVPALGGVS